MEMRGCSKCVFAYKELTLGAHAKEGYGSCLVYVCACVCVTTAAATSFIYTHKAWYVHFLGKLLSRFSEKPSIRKL